MDANCKQELNQQLQGMEARISQCEAMGSNLYKAMSMLAIATSSEVTAVIPLVATILNGTPELFQVVLQLLPNPQAFVSIAMQFVLSNLGTPSLSSMLNQATGVVQGKLAELTGQLQNLIANNATVEEINAVKAQIAKYQNAADSAVNFFKAQNDLSACRIAASKIGGF